MLAQNRILRKFAKYQSDSSIQKSCRPRPLYPFLLDRARHWGIATNAFVLLNATIFIAMVRSGASPIISDADTLLKWGANFGPYFKSGQYWRLLTAPLVHLDISHLAINMLFLWWLGRIVEKTFGAFILILACLVTGVGAAFGSMIYDSQRVIAGSSGIVFGLAGMVITFFAREKREALEVKLIFGRSITIVIVGLVYGFAPGADNIAHLAGFITGSLLGLFCGWLLNRSAPPGRLLGTAILYRAQAAIERNEFELAVTNLSACVGAHPRNYKAQALLGYALDMLERFDEAAQHYTCAIMLKSADEITEVNLAGIYLCQNRVNNAVELIEKGYSGVSH